MLGFLATKLFQPFLKPLKYFVDDNFRSKVEPIEGSVLYSNLYAAVEHSGIYVGDGQISNIVVDSLLKGESTVRLSDARDFTDRSLLGKKIYVSCDKHGKPVGDFDVCDGAMNHVGDRGFYGLVFKNCHTFSRKCVNYSKESYLVNSIKPDFDVITELPTNFLFLKKAANYKINARKWLLWDWEQSNQKQPEPDWQEIQQQYKNQPLTPEYIEQLQQELEQTKEYQQEISDENIPKDILNKLQGFQQNLQNISDKYEQVKGFLATCPDAQFSYQQLQDCKIDFTALAKQLQNNTVIKDLARKMGRNYISEEKKKQAKIPTASKSEVHGTHRSDDVMRLLPSELINLEDETLETLFYARLLEQNLLTYELQGITFINGEEIEQQHKRTGPVVACLDTSGSMQGEPLLKAKALLFAIANILKQEQRSLHVILFGSSGELKEFQMLGAESLADLLQFLQQGFNGGTDFETPLKRAVDIIKAEKNYQKADILMISDGDCNLSDYFSAQLQGSKDQLNCMVYSVLCAGQRVKDNFSDEIVVL